MDITQFRLDFPEFTSTQTYPNSMITYWSTLGEKLHAEPRFGNVYNNVIELYTAHCISVQAGDIAVSNSGGIPTGNAGEISSKTVGTVSVDYDTTWSFENNGGWFNLTVYGRQYLQLAKMYGKGGFISCQSRF